jgi:hypothetical protein
MAEAESRLSSYRRPMEGTLRLTAWLEGRAGPWGAAGGLLLYAFWNRGARDLTLPDGVVVPLHLATALLLTVGVVGHQLRQGTCQGSWVGWGGAAAVGMGFWTSHAMLSGGLLLFAVAAARCGVHRPATASLLASGATLLMMTTALAPGFATDNSVPMSSGWLLLMNAGLVLVAAAMTDLALAQRGRGRTARA